MPIGAVDGFKYGCLLELDINEEMVIEKLALKLTQDKAGGADELVPRLLILIKDEISYPLTVLFKKIVSSGCSTRRREKGQYVSPIYNKKLSCRRGTARCVVSIEILLITTQQCRNYLYDKS